MLFVLKAPVFADLEAGFAWSEQLCTYSSTARGSFIIFFVSLFCTHVSYFLSVASPKNCLFICLCFVGCCFCVHCLATTSLCHYVSLYILSLLLVVVLWALLHSSSYFFQPALLSFCLNGNEKLFCKTPGRPVGGDREKLLSTVCIRSWLRLHACMQPECDHT